MLLTDHSASSHINLRELFCDLQSERQEKEGRGEMTNFKKIESC